MPIEACGYRNVYAELRAAAPAVSLESVAARDPDVIVVLAADARKRAGLGRTSGVRCRQLRAVKHGRAVASSMRA